MDDGNRREVDRVTPNFEGDSPFGGVKNPQGVFEHQTLMLDDGKPLRQVAWPNRDNPNLDKNESEFSAVLAADGNYRYLRRLTEEEIDSRTYDESLDYPSEKKAKATPKPAPEPQPEPEPPQDENSDSTEESGVPKS